MEKLIIITGPTASGKTSLGIQLAKHLNTEIINADSVIFYKHLNIGSAKPDFEEREGIPHHLIDILELDQHFTAHDFMGAADQKIKELTAQKLTPIISGGSPLYIKALLKGFFEMPEPSPEQKIEIKARIDAMKPGERHQYLQSIDPDAAERLHPNDLQRINRAIEVFLATGTPLSTFQKQHQFQNDRYQYLKLAINYPREELYRRINLRVDLMIQGGIIEEVENLLKQGFHPDTHKSMGAIGYREIVDHLEGRYTLDESIELLKQNTRRFAKRQLTWLRKESEIKWVSPDTAYEESLTHLLNFLD